MGVKELRAAFNEVTSMVATCSKALLEYERHSDTEFQVLYFSGNYADGVGFVTKSDRIRPNEDVILVARATAERLLAIVRPPSETPVVEPVPAPLPAVDAAPVQTDAEKISTVDLTKLDDAQLAELNSRVDGQIKSRLPPEPAPVIEPPIDAPVKPVEPVADVPVALDEETVKI